MGLDMYLYKTKKVEGFSAMDYAYADMALDYKREKAKAKEVGEKFMETLASWGVPESMTLDKAKALESEYKNVGKYLEWFSIFDTVWSWRKVNHIHAWFVRNVQGGTDDCSYYFVSKDHFLELKETCEKVLALNPFSIDENSDLFYTTASTLIDNGVITKADYEEMEGKLEELMPTQAGFFFGGTDYSPFYFQTVEEVLEIANTILKNGDFDKEVYLYHSSW
jgi:hypothetical protein